MPAAARLAPAEPVLPPRLAAAVWHAHSLAGAQGLAPCWATGHAALDTVLPGGGWPSAGLTELLHPAGPGLGLPPPVWSLLAPACARALARRGPDDPQGPLVLVGLAGLGEAARASASAPPAPKAAPPWQPFAPSLAALGLPANRLWWVPTSHPDEAGWACEQALGCGEVVAVVAWLPALGAARLRRLHLKAVDAAKPLFLWRPEPTGLAAAQASAAPLRLRVQPGPAQPEAEAAVAGWRVEVLKRRGPPLAQALQLPGWAQPWLGAWALPAPQAGGQAEAERPGQVVAPAPAQAMEPATPPAAPRRPPLHLAWPAAPASWGPRRPQGGLMTGAQAQAPRALPPATLGMLRQPAGSAASASMRASVGLPLEPSPAPRLAPPFSPPLAPSPALTTTVVGGRA